MTRTIRGRLQRVVAIALMLASIQVAAEQPPEPTSAEWRTLLQRMPSAQFVWIGLRDGTAVEGTLLRAGDTDFTVQRRTRIPVSTRTIRYEEVRSVEPKKRPWSAGRKAATVIGITAGVLLILGAAVAGATADLLSGP